MEELKVSFPGGVRVDVAYKGHVIHTDQPEYSGGGGTAPSPFDLFLASLAACAGYYLLAFCQARKLSIQGGGVTMKTERHPQSKMVSRVEIVLHLPADFPQHYTPAVVKAVDACTVRAHLLQPPAIQVLTQRAV